MRRLVALSFALAVIGCSSGEPELTKEQRDALQTIGEWKGRLSDDAWRSPEAYADAGHIAESDRLKFKVTRIRRQEVDGDSKLVIAWEAKNVSESAKIDDALPIEDNPTLHVTDEFGNEYDVDSLFRLDRAVAEDYEYEPESLYPGDSATDALICQLPVSGAKKLFVWFRQPGDPQGHPFAFKLNIPLHAQAP